jgi:GNAT superfamily N-acetyltransferase
MSAVLIEPLSADAFVAAHDDLVHLLRACVDGGASVGFMSPMPLADAAAYWRSLEPQIQSGTRIVLIAREGPGGRIVGTGQLVPAAFPNGRHRAEVAKVLVLPLHRRQGIATRIMRALEDHARAAGRWLLHLDTTEGASGATGLYESLGYTMAGGIPEWARDPDGPLKTTVIYFKKLT